MNRFCKVLVWFWRTFSEDHGGSSKHQIRTISRNAFHSKNVLEHGYQDRGVTFLVIKIALTVTDIQIQETASFITLSHLFFPKSTISLNAFSHTLKRITAFGSTIPVQMRSVLCHVVQCIISALMSVFCICVPRRRIYSDSNHTVCHFSIARVTTYAIIVTFYGSHFQALGGPGHVLIGTSLSWKGDENKLNGTILF